MKRTPASIARRLTHASARVGLSMLPRQRRFALYRRMIDCDSAPDSRLELKIADQRDELEACFRLLHDSYVAAGFMRPDPSGLRVTIYHALPTTTTLCAKFDGQVVGTLSIIREGVFGFPLQSAFDLTPVRAGLGRLAEISALAIDPAFRRTGGKLLFPLMKFMYEYCREYFDTRHIVIAVNPNKIELYESLLLFERLQAAVVDSYAFANGAPAVGATLDLLRAPVRFQAAYSGRAARKDLHRYFVDTPLPNIRWPQRRFFTTNDPVMTPPMLDHFFNQRTKVFATLNERKRMLLHSIYDGPGYAAVLPPAPVMPAQSLRQHRRFSIRCPATLWVDSYGTRLCYAMHVIELSLGGFQAECPVPLPEGTRGRVRIELGEREFADIDAVAVRRQPGAGVVYYGFGVRKGDDAWYRCVAALHAANTHADVAPLRLPAASPPRLPGGTALTGRGPMGSAVGGAPQQNGVGVTFGASPPEDRDCEAAGSLRTVMP